MRAGSSAAPSTGRTLPIGEPALWIADSNLLWGRDSARGWRWNMLLANRRQRCLVEEHKLERGFGALADKVIGVAFAIAFQQAEDGPMYSGAAPPRWSTLFFRPKWALAQAREMGGPCSGSSSMVLSFPLRLLVMRMPRIYGTLWAGRRPNPAARLRSKIV